jgi:hypothetical protein
MKTHPDFVQTLSSWELLGLPACPSSQLNYGGNILFFNRL